MRDSQRFNFIEGLDAFGFPDALPKLPLTLMYRALSVEVSALLDTGASVNVLPYSKGFVMWCSLATGISAFYDVCVRQLTGALNVGL